MSFQLADEIVTLSYKRNKYLKGVPLLKVRIGRKEYF